MEAFDNINFRKIIIETDTLILKDIPFADRKRIFEIFSNVDVVRYTDKKPVSNIDEAILYLHEIHEKSDLKKHIYLGIYDKSGSNLNGIVSLYHLDMKHKFGSLGILLDNKCWRKGIMSEALYNFLEYCFKIFDFHRIEAQTFVNNLPAVRFFEKLKFTNEGRLRENFLIAGKFEDSYIFSMLNQDFFHLNKDLIC